MTPVEAWLFWAGVILYGAASACFLAGFIFGRRRLVRYALPLALAGFILNTAVIAVRWSATGHPPLMGDYESSLSRSWVVLALFLGLQLRFPALRPLGMVVLPFALLNLGYGSMRSPILQPLSPAYRSPWLFIHIAFALLTYAAYALAAALSVLFLLKIRKGTASAFYERFPVPEIMDELSYKLIAFGFIADSVMMVAGAIWANSLWGAYWSWDPIQTWAFISWLTYGIYLHLRVIHRWRMKRAAWLSVAAIITVIISFWVTNYMGVGLHVF